MIIELTWVCLSLSETGFTAPSMLCTVINNHIEPSGSHPTRGESTRCKPKARTLICHRPFGRSSSRLLALVGIQWACGMQQTCKCITLRYIEINHSKTITTDKQATLNNVTSTTLVLHSYAALGYIEMEHSKAVTIDKQAMLNKHSQHGTRAPQFARTLQWTLTIKHITLVKLYINTHITRIRYIHYLCRTSTVATPHYVPIYGKRTSQS
jgi:hypothetical protein